MPRPSAIAQSARVNMEAERRLVFEEGDGSNQSEKQLDDNINLAMSVSGGIGVLIASGILGGVLCGKAYKTLLQRLFIYAVLAVLIHDSCHIADIVHRYNTAPQVCSFLGFLANWSSWSVNLFYLAMILIFLW